MPVYRTAQSWVTGVLLNAGAEVHCDATVEDYALVYTNSVVRTSAKVGKYARIGSNATICNHAVVPRLAAAHENRAQSKTEKLVERIAAYIDNCAESEFPDLTVLSEAFGVTPQYISNVFKKYRDENVKDYIARRKLAQAKALLTGTDLPVREVAARLGYAGEIGIIRLFRKYEGTTPGDYRAQHK